jgi:hypothetical protein
MPTARFQLPRSIPMPSARTYLAAMIGSSRRPKAQYGLVRCSKPSRGFSSMSSTYHSAMHISPAA